MPLQNTPEAFAAQLREGHYNELRVALFFMLRSCRVRIGFVDGRFDVEVEPPRGEVFHVEVKWDKRAADTGNLYFEVENTRRKAPSGVRATRAGWWCHVLGDSGEALIVEVERLRSFLEHGGFRAVHTQADDSNSLGLLVPRGRLEALPGARWVRLPDVPEFFGEVFRRAEGRPG